jgi:hypothetical protein
MVNFTRLFWTSSLLAGIASVDTEPVTTEDAESPPRIHTTLTGGLSPGKVRPWPVRFYARIRRWLGI